MVPPVSVIVALSFFFFFLWGPFLTHTVFFLIEPIFETGDFTQQYSSFYRNRLTDLEKIMVSGGRMRGRDSYRVWDGQGHKARFKMDNQQGPAEAGVDGPPG